MLEMELGHVKEQLAQQLEELEDQDDLQLRLQAARMDVDDYRRRLRQLTFERARADRYSVAGDSGGTDGCPSAQTAGDTPGGRQDDSHQELSLESAGDAGPSRHH